MGLTNGGSEVAHRAKNDPVSRLCLLNDPITQAIRGLCRDMLGLDERHRFLERELGCQRFGQKKIDERRWMGAGIELDDKARGGALPQKLGERA